MLHVGKNNVFVSFLPVMNPASLLQRKTPAAATSATSPIFPNIWNFAAMSSHLSRRPSRTVKLRSNNKQGSNSSAREIKKENELLLEKKEGHFFFVFFRFGTIWKKASARARATQVFDIPEILYGCKVQNLSRLMCHLEINISR